MKNRDLTRLLCCAALTLSMGAQAQTASSGGASGELATAWSKFMAGVKPKPYVQGAFGTVQTTSPSATGMTIDLKGSSNATSARLALGLQLNESFGVEGAWFSLPEAAAATPTGEAKYKGSAYALSLSGNFPVNAAIKLVGRLGAGRSDMSVLVPSAPYSSTSAQNLTVLGLGVRFNVSTAVDVTLDYDNLGTVGKYAKGQDVKADMLSLGLRYKF